MIQNAYGNFNSGLLEDIMTIRESSIFGMTALGKTFK